MIDSNRLVFAMTDDGDIRNRGKWEKIEGVGVKKEGTGKGVRRE